MTTTVKVSAHCSDSVEVKIVVAGSGSAIEQTTLQDGEETDMVVFDDRAITVYEVNK